MKEQHTETPGGFTKSELNILLAALHDRRLKCATELHKPRSPQGRRYWDNQAQGAQSLYTKIIKMRYRGTT